MFSDRVFLTALAISLVIHAAILFQSPNLKLFKQKEKQKLFTKLELRYLKGPKQISASAQKPSSKSEALLKLPDKIVNRPLILPPMINKEDIFRSNKQSLPQKELFPKPAFIKPEMTGIKTKISLAPDEPEKNNSPSYMAHSQVVREKIKRALYENYNRTEVGQVYLSFMLSRDGSLKEIHLVEEKSTPSAYLKEIAMRSIKDAAPFPGFPPALNYDQLSFNVVISFEIE